MPAVPADANSLPLLPVRNAGAQFIDDTGDFRALEPGDNEFRATGLSFVSASLWQNTTGLNFDTHFSSTRRGNFPLNDLEICSRLRNLRRLHWNYCDFRSCHGASFEFSPSRCRMVHLRAARTLYTPPS